VKWCEDGGINRHQHKDYLRQIKKHFEETMISMVDQSIETSRKFLGNAHFMEVYQHLAMAKDRCQMFQGRERLLSSIQQKLNTSRGKPLVMHGLSGSGKTSIIAKCAQQVSESNM
jgi:signal recognition particle GTPase